MKDKLPHELSIEELKELGEQKRKMYCLAVSKMNKDELIKYIYGKEFTKTEFGKNFMENNYKKMKVAELKKNAGVLKKQACLPVQKMTKKELLKYLFELILLGLDIDDKNFISECRKQSIRFETQIEMMLKNIKNSISFCRFETIHNINKKPEILGVLHRSFRANDKEWVYI